MRIIDETLEKKLKSVIASMSFEGLDLTEDEIEDCRKVLYGEATADDLIAKVLAKYEKTSTQS